MDQEHSCGAQQLRDAALVHAACRRVAAAIAELAARPLDQAAAEQMRRALHGAHRPSARAALSRLSPGDPAASTAVPHLSVVTSQHHVPQQPVAPPVAGGAA